MEVQGDRADSGAIPKQDTKQTISKLRAKVNPEHVSYMGDAWRTSPDGQEAVRRIAGYDPGRATPGRSTLAGKIAIQTKLDSIKAIGEATKANTVELLQQARGTIPERSEDQTAAERKREIDETLKSVPALREEGKKMAALARQEAKEARRAPSWRCCRGRARRT